MLPNRGVDDEAALLLMTVLSLCVGGLSFPFLSTYVKQVIMKMPGFGSRIFACREMAGMMMCEDVTLFPLHHNRTT
jgi:hypothetical protein